MPAAVAAATAFTVAGVAVTYGALAYAAQLVATVGFSHYSRRKAKKAALAALEDRTFPIRTSDAPRTIVYGETRTSGVIIYGAAHDGETDLGVNDEVTLIYTLAGHPIDSVQQVWFNDKWIGALSNYEVTGGSDYFRGVNEALGSVFSPTSNSQTFTISEPGLINTIDTVSYTFNVYDFNAGSDNDQIVRREQVVLEDGVDYVKNISAKTVTLTNSGRFDLIGVDLVVTYTATRGSSKARVRAFLGSEDGERDQELERWTVSQDAPWTAQHLGKGVARLHVTHRWDETIYTAGIPNVSAVVRGKRVYDPRLDSTNGGSGSQRIATPSTWVWSRNPALCASDYLMDLLGFGVAPSKIDWPSVIAAANACDEPVDSEPRYTCDGVISTDEARKANLEAILSSMVGSAYYSGGKWFLRAGVANVATPYAMDESDLAGGEITLIARQPRSELFNAVRGRFKDPQKLYAISDFPPYSSSVYAAEDNGEVVYEDFELSMTQSSKMAQRIAKLILNRARQAVTLSADFKLSAYKLQPGDTVTLTMARYGWAAKLFRVVEREFSDLSRIRLVLQEEAPAVYQWDFNADATTVDPAPNSNLPDPRYVSTPAGITITPDFNDATPTSFYTRSDGTAVPYIDVNWNAPTSADVTTEVYWKRAEELEFRFIRTSANATTARIEPVSGGDVFNIYLVHVSATGARSLIYWIPRFTINSRLPSNGQPVGVLSANMLANASWESGTGRWTNIFGPAIFQKELSPYPIAGPVSNGRLQINSTATGAGNTAYVTSDRVAVREGARYVAYCGMIPWAVDGFVALYWYDFTDKEISGINSPLVPGYAGDGVSPKRPTSLADYANASLFATAPTGARYARLFLVAGGVWTASDFSGSKYLWLAKPFFGEVPLGVTELPPWDAGGSPVLGSGGLIPGATTDVEFGETPGASFRSPAPATLAINIASLGATVSGIWEITATFEVSASGTGGGGGGENRMYASIYETLKGVPIVSREVLTAPANENRKAVATLTATISVDAGETITPVLWVSRSRFGIVSGVVVGNSTDSVGVITWRATLIKR